MATTIDFIEFVCEQIEGAGEIRCKKMFGEYCVYVNDKPLLLVCDNTVFVKKLDCIAELMRDSREGYPYEGAKLNYMLDIEDRDLVLKVLRELERVVPIPKPRKPKQTK